MRPFQVPVSELVPYINNAKLHPERQIKEIAASIVEFGFCDPVAYAKDTKVIIAGHGRLEAALRLKMEAVPAFDLSHLSEAQRKAYALAHNKLSMNTDFDLEKLRLEMQGLAELDFNIANLGFNQRELDKLMADLDKDVNQDRPEIKKSATLADLAPTEEEMEVLAGREILVEFSGGKDSSTAAVWARHYFPEAEIVLCFADLGAEFTGYQIFLYDFVDFLRGRFVPLRAPENILDMFLRKGDWPVFTRPFCRELLNETLNSHYMTHDPEKIVIFRGGRLQERGYGTKTSDSRFFSVTGNVPSVKGVEKYKFFQPLYFTSKAVGEQVLEETGAPVWDGYSYGLQRTACRICPGQRKKAYAAIRANYPEVWAELLWLEGRLGTGYWQDPVDGKVSNLTQMAEWGQEAFEKGEYKRRGGGPA
jgi:3'-phosphoadenosine 5'-phosphosulfate sulfotransferase (PAPS reductase)/FAD synthetase